MSVVCLKHLCGYVTTCISNDDAKSASLLMTQLQRYFCHKVKVKKVKISLFQAVEAHRVARG
jgi:hypothetical protein